VFLTALVLVIVGVGVCLAGMRKTFRYLEIDPMQTFLWLGLAEIPAPDVPPRRRPVA
jgi:hypothetical protein